MLKHYLEKAIDALERLIELTEKDIEDIKAARHDVMFDRLKTKEHSLVAFESHKALIDRTMAELIRRHPESELNALLDEETQRLLGRLRERLEALQEVNRRYARLVIVVGEFYNALYEEILPIERDGYTGKSAKAASFLEVRA